jgi:ribosomal protein L28
MVRHCAKAWHRGASEGSMAAAMGLRPMHVVHGSAQSSFAGTVRCFSNLSIACRPSHCRQPLTVEGECSHWKATSRRTCQAEDVQHCLLNRPAHVSGRHVQNNVCKVQLCHIDMHCAAAARRQCDLTGKVANNGYNVTFSHKRNKKLQGVNLQEKKVYWPAKQRWVTLKLSTKVWSRP